MNSAIATAARATRRPPEGDGLATALKSIADRAGEAETDPSGLTVETQALARAGLLSACLPYAADGGGLGVESGTAEKAFALLRRLGRASLPVARLFEGHMNAVKLLQLYGHSALTASAYAAVRSGAMFGVWGADGERPLRFSGSGGCLRLGGEKIFASGLGVVRFAIVTLREEGSDRSPSALALVDVSDPARQDPGSWQAAGMRATLSGRFDFSGLDISTDQFLGEPGDYEREPHFEGGIWRYCAAHLGGAEALIELWRQALAARGRLDDPLQLTRFARAMSLCRAMASLLRETSATVESSASQNRACIDAAVAEALLARQFTEESCVEILQLAEKSLGTVAHIRGTSIERIRRDLSVFIRQAAPDAKLLKAGRLLSSSDLWDPSW